MRSTFDSNGLRETLRNLFSGQRKGLARKFVAKNSGQNLKVIPFHLRVSVPANQIEIQLATKARRLNGV